MRYLYMLYGLACYGVFFYTFTYLILFIGSVQAYIPALAWIFPSHIDNGQTTTLDKDLLINGGLIVLFAVQHSVMARQGFKKIWSKFIPRPIERSTYVLITSLIFLLMIEQWRSIQGEVWHLYLPGLQWMMWVLFITGWGLVFYSSFLINHFDLFGLRQVFLAFKNLSYTPLPFYVNNLYCIVRHPLYLGVIIGMWAIPVMTFSHLFFSASMTLYIFIGMYLEEKDMVHFFGDEYRDYQKQVPKIFPKVWK